jgi:hypothetical protein
LKFLLEARNSTEVSTGPLMNPRANQVRDFLDGFAPRAFRIGVIELVAGSKDLRRKSLACHINKSLNRTPADGACTVLIPPFETEDGWKIRLEAIPDGLGGGRNRSVLYEVWCRTRGSPSKALSKALIEKASRYGNNFEMPFILAISSFDAMLADRDFAEALFGEQGLWGTVNNPRYGRASAVLFTVNLWPATLFMGHVETRLYLNPFACWPYNGALTKLDTFRFENGSWRCYPGTRIHQLLELNLRNSSLWD